MNLNGHLYTLIELSRGNSLDTLWTRDKVYPRTDLGAVEKGTFFEFGQSKSSYSDIIFACELLELSTVWVRKYRRAPLIRFNWDE
jgi:hypothetical protein